MRSFGWHMLNSAIQCRGDNFQWGTRREREREIQLSFCWMDHFHHRFSFAFVIKIRKKKIVKNKQTAATKPQRTHRIVAVVARIQFQKVCHSYRRSFFASPLIVRLERCLSKAMVVSFVSLRTHTPTNTMEHRLIFCLTFFLCCHPSHRHLRIFYRRSLFTIIIITYRSMTDQNVR